MSKDLIDKFQQAVGIVTIFLVNFAGEAVAVIHHGVLVISTVQHYTAGENDETGEEDEQNFKALLAPVNEVTVENVAICVGRQTVLFERKNVKY